MIFFVLILAKLFAEIDNQLQTTDLLSKGFPETLETPLPMPLVVSLHKHYNTCSAWFLHIRIYQLVCSYFTSILQLYSYFENHSKIFLEPPLSVHIQQHSITIPLTWNTTLSSSTVHQWRQKGELKGLEPPNFTPKGAEPLQNNL